MEERASDYLRTYIKKKPSDINKLEYILELILLYCDYNFEPESSSFYKREGNPSWKECEVACTYINDLIKESNNHGRTNGKSTSNYG